LRSRTSTTRTAVPLPEKFLVTRILAVVVARGADTLVPTELGVGCDDRIDRVARRFRHLDADPYPHGVLESHISAVANRFDVAAVVAVEPPDDGWTVVDRVHEYFCAYPGSRDDRVHLRLTERSASTPEPEIECALLA
jgi:hypothetical protein